MQTIDASRWLSQAAVEKLGWVLVHSFWQLTAISLLAWLLDRALQRRSSSVRYWSLLLSLLVMMASPVVTWMMLPTSVDEDVAAVSDGNPGLGPMMPETPLPATNMEPITPAKEIRTTAAEIQESSATTSASFSVWMNQCAVFLKPWLGTIVSVWCFGVLMFSVRPVVSWVNVQRLKRQGTSAVSESVRQTLTMLAQKLQVRQRVDVLISTVVTSPIVVGCFRSVILLPASFIAGVPPAQLEAILAHELAHVKRYDYFLNLIQTLVETLFFYHPAVWWLSHRIRIERENCCDDMVVTALNNKVDYGRALLAVEEHRGQVSALALSAKGGSLVARVRRLFSEPVHDGSQTAAGILSCGTLLAILMLAMMWPRAIARDETPIGTEKPNIVENEPPRGSCENGKSVSFVGIRICGAPNDHWWWPNGRESVVKEGRWSPSSTDYGPKGRDFLFDFSGFGRCPSLRVRTPSLGQENYIDQVDQTIQQSDRLLDYSQITEFDGFVEPSTAKVWITDEPWGPWLQVKTDGDLLNPIDMNDTFNRIYSLIKASPVINDGKFIRPAISFSWPANFAEFVDFEFRAIGSDGADIDCSQSFEETGLTFTVRESHDTARESHDTAQQFSHFEFRLRPYRYLTTFRNIVVDGPTDSPSQVKVEVKKLTDSEILAALTSTSPQQKTDEGNDESKRTVSIKADVNQAPSALKNQIVATFKNDAELNERLKLAKERAAGENKRIAIVIAKPDSQQADWFYSLLQGTDDDLKRWRVDESAIKEIRQSLPRFQLLWVDAAQFDELRRLIPDHEFEDQHESSMVFLESDGSWLCHFEPDPTKEPRRALENLGSAVDLHKDGKKNEGKLQGRIHLEGQAPRLTPVTVPTGAVGNAKKLAFVNESLLVGEKNGLANAFVYLKKAPTGWNLPTETESGTLVKVTPKGFSPRASILQVGHDLTIDNTLPVVANPVLMPVKNKPFNHAIAPTKRLFLKSPFKNRESLPVRLKSDIHLWMEGYVLALDHPFAAVSDTAGGFQIDNLPPGEYEFSVWHERVGVLKPLQVQIKGDETSTVDLPVSSDAFSKK